MRQKNESRGGCPRCEKSIPFKRAMLHRGRPFECSGCGTSIVLSKPSTGFAIAAFATLSLLSGKVPTLLIVILFAAGLAFEWLLSSVRVAAYSPSSDAADAA
jgi:hypothetical protein